MKPDNNTKIKIRERAIQLFKEKGYDNVTINDICDDCGLSKNTFYYYFKSKEQILKMVMVLPEQFSPEEMNQILFLDSPYEQYCEFLKKRLRHFETCGKDIVKKILVAQMTNSFALDEECEATKEKPFVIMQVGFIQKAQEKGEIKNMSNPLDLVHAAFCLLVGITQVWATHQTDKFHLEEEYFKLLDAMMEKSV